MKATIILVIILLILLWRYTSSKEGFESKAKLDTFLNTWHLTNKELKNTMTSHDKAINFSKDIVFPKEKGIILGTSGNKNMGDVSHKGTIRMIGNGEMHIVGGGQPRRINLYDDVFIGGKIRTSLNLATYQSINLDQGSINVTGWNPGHGKISAQREICIDGVCINKNHLQALKGERNVFLKNNAKAHFMDCGGKSGDGASTKGMKAGRTCYVGYNKDKNNGNQQFRIMI